jgi:hypothetical protein
MEVSPKLINITKNKTKTAPYVQRIREVKSTEEYIVPKIGQQKQPFNISNDHSSEISITESNKTTIANSIYAIKY